MEWYRIFNSENDAFERLKERNTQLILISGKRICLAFHKGRFYAVQDRCTHNGESLSKGTINFQCEIVCPWHNYRFDLVSGKATDSDCSDLEVYPIKVGEDGFFIGI